MCFIFADGTFDENREEYPAVYHEAKKVTEIVGVSMSPVQKLWLIPYDWLAYATCEMWQA